jgi:hypothetical protein
MRSVTIEGKTWSIGDRVTTYVGVGILNKITPWHCEVKLPHCLMTIHYNHLVYYGG